MGQLNYLAHVKQRIEKLKDEDLYHCQQQQQQQQASGYHSDYTRFAAVDAIKRHAFSYLQKDVTVSNIFVSGNLY